MLLSYYTGISYFRVLASAENSLILVLIFYDSVRTRRSLSLSSNSLCVVIHDFRPEAVANRAVVLVLVVSLMLDIRNLPHAREISNLIFSIGATVAATICRVLDQEVIDNEHIAFEAMTRALAWFGFLVDSSVKRCRRSPGATRPCSRILKTA